VEFAAKCELAVCSVGWTNAIDALGVIQISAGAGRARTPMKSYSPRTHALTWLFSGIQTKCSVINCWPITCPSSPRCLINLSIYLRKTV